MNKILCDVCGTSYPETAPQCPICGTAKTDANKTTTGAEPGYAYVKGGRFSHANVRKRNAGKKELPRVVAPVKPAKEPAEPKQPKTPEKKKEETTENTAVPVHEKKSTNVVLALIAFVLVLGIVAVFAFFVKDYMETSRNNKTTEPTGITASTPKGTAVTCTGVRLALSSKTFTSKDDKFYLSVIPTPINTTDPITYETSDPLVATVNENGVVTPVANGEAIIYVHCGDFTAECYITCNVGVDQVPPTQPDGPTQPDQNENPEVELVLNREDFTLNGYGDSWNVYGGASDPALITWTSSDASVATVTNGKVVAVGNGNATITAEYMGQKVTCEVHCKNVVVSNYELRTRYGRGDDFTISVGDTIVLYLQDKETKLRIQASNLTFSLSKEGIISIDEEGEITALATGNVTVTVTYGDQTFKAKVYVKKAK